MQVRRLLPIGASLLALAACGGSDAGTAAPPAPMASPAAPAATAAPATTSAPATTLADVTWGTATFVTGTVRGFTIDEGTVSTAADGQVRSRDGSFAYDLVSADPRVAGHAAGTWNSDRWGSDPTDGALVQWGDATLTNAGGAWSSAWAGVMASPVGDMLSRWWVGSGGYAGLTFYMTITAKDIGDPSARWYGLVYEGAPPPGAA